MRRSMLTSHIFIFLFFVVLAAELCLPLARMVQLSANRKQINAYSQAISALTTDTQHLQFQISMKENPNELREKAIALGMTDAAVEQMYLVTLPAGYGEATVVQATDSQNAG